VKILVDADSCPPKTREIIINCANRLHIAAIFAANRPIPGIKGRGISMEVCEAAEGAADQRIVDLAETGDLVVSRDIPLAQKLVAGGISVINDRGREYTNENIREMLSLRNFAIGLSDNGLGAERIASYGKKEIKKFADSLDRIITRLKNRPASQPIDARGTDSASV